MRADRPNGLISRRKVYARLRRDQLHIDPLLIHSVNIEKMRLQFAGKKRRMNRKARANWRKL